MPANVGSRPGRSRHSGHSGAHTERTLRLPCWPLFRPERALYRPDLAPRGADRRCEAREPDAVYPGTEYGLVAAIAVLGRSERWLRGGIGGSYGLTLSWPVTALGGPLRTSSIGLGSRRGDGEGDGAGADSS